MNIKELSENVYEDLNGQIVSVDCQETTVTLFFECDHWKDLDKRISIQIRCSEVVENAVSPGFSGFLQWEDNHPLLLKHNKQHGSLFFTSKPTKPYEVIGILYQAHEDLFKGWRPLSDHINQCGKTNDILASGSGLLARGPIPVLELYQNSLEGLIQTNIIKSYTPNGGYKALILDEFFLVCKEVKLTQL